MEKVNHVFFWSWVASAFWGELLLAFADVNVSWNLFWHQLPHIFFSCSLNVIFNLNENKSWFDREIPEKSACQIIQPFLSHKIYFLIDKRTRIILITQDYHYCFRMHCYCSPDVKLLSSIMFLTKKKNRIEQYQKAKIEFEPYWHSLSISLQAVADIIRTTLGPRSMLKMLLDAGGGDLISVDK